MDAGAQDLRCLPWHVVKLTARMQAANSGSNLILMRVREGVGHGTSEKEGRHTQNVDWLTFCIDQLGLEPSN